MEPHHAMFADEIAWFFNTETNLNLSQILEYEVWYYCCRWWWVVEVWWLNSVMMGLFEWLYDGLFVVFEFVFFIISFWFPDLFGFDLNLYMWGPVISGVLLRLYGMSLRPNDPIWGYWQVQGWSVKVITGVALTEELKVIMVIPNLSEVKSHLRTFVWGGLKPSYPSEYSFNVTSWQGVEHWIKGREEENKYLRELLPPH